MAFTSQRLGAASWWRSLGALAQITDYAEPVRNGAWWPAQPEVLVFARDAGGNPKLVAKKRLALLD